MPNLFIDFEKVLASASGNFEEQNKVLVPSVIIINCIIKKVKVKVKQSRYRPVVAQRVPGS